MQDEFKVYGRGGEPCDRCGTPIAKSRVGGRGTWFCPTCQPLDGSGSEQRVEPAVAVEAPELGVAADRLAVDQDLRHGPAAASDVVDRLAERGIVVEGDLLVRDALRVEQRLRPHAVAAPARRIHLNPGHYWF